MITSFFLSTGLLDYLHVPWWSAVVVGSLLFNQLLQSMSCLTGYLYTVCRELQRNQTKHRPSANKSSSSSIPCFTSSEAFPHLSTCCSSLTHLWPIGHLYLPLISCILNSFLSHSTFFPALLCQSFVTICLKIHHFLLLSVLRQCEEWPSSGKRRLACKK